MGDSGWTAGSEAGAAGDMFSVNHINEGPLLGWQPPILGGTLLPRNLIIGVRWYASRKRRRVGCIVEVEMVMGAKDGLNPRKEMI